jgi:hypothetical protein
MAPLLEGLAADGASLQLYRRERLETCTVGELAVQALRWRPAPAEER